MLVNDVRVKASCFVGSVLWKIDGNDHNPFPRAEDKLTHNRNIIWQGRKKNLKHFFKYCILP